MRLSAFLRNNREAILAEWEAFARTCLPVGGDMPIDALRDHAGEMLQVIADDLDTPQSSAQQAEKAKGRAPQPADHTRTAAEMHGTGRALSGFTIEQMVAEYRALRASVVRLWSEAEADLNSADIQDLIRFNEAIDQALAESVTRFSREIARAQEMFIAMLGHDLRTPLGAISTSAQFMLDRDELDDTQRTLSRGIAKSAAHTLGMVGDLLDFTRARLGDGIPLVRQSTDLARLLRDVADEITAAHPDASIDLEVHGEQRGSWDRARLRQAVTNLVDNAVRHGADGEPVRVTANGDGHEVTIAVHNTGKPIPEDELDAIFSPMKPRPPGRPAAANPMASLGLGLYIAERIASAHGGSIHVQSSEAAGTTFTMRLPRHGS